MKKPRIYVAGPMRGIELYNFPMFDLCRDALCEEWDVVSPADLDRKVHNFDPTAEDYQDEEFSEKQYRRVLLRDLKEICGVDAIAFLPGWERSLGANAERKLGEALGLEAYLYRPGATKCLERTDWRELDEDYFDWQDRNAVPA